MAHILLNSFQTPNHYVDEAMALLSAEEYKCLSFATRHILGWQDKINKRRGFISLRMFEHGFVSAKGVTFGGTGLTRPTIIRATDELTRLLFLIKIGEPTQDGQEWELGDDPDFYALAVRHASRQQQRRSQTLKARSAKQEGGLLNIPPAGGLSNKPEVVTPTNQQWSVGQTGSGLSDIPNQIQVQNHLQMADQTKADAASVSDPTPKTLSPDDAWVKNHVNPAILDRVKGGF